MNDSIPPDPIRSLVDTSVEDDENDDEDDGDVDAAADDDRHHIDVSVSVEAQEQHLQNQTNQRRRGMQIRTEAPNASPHSHFNDHLLTDASHSNAVSITPVHYIPYVHGGYSAAAPLFVTHTKFAHILKKLLPGAYEELSILLRACAVNGGTTAAAAGGGGGGGKREQQMAATGGGKKHTEEIIDASYANHCDKNLGGQHLNIFGINNTTLSKYTNDVDRTEKRMSSSTSPTVSTNMNDRKNGIPGSAGLTPAVETTEVILADPVKIMKWAENNPVVSAFGIWNSDSGRRTFTFMNEMMPTIRKVSNDGNDDDDDNDISCDYGDNTDDDCNYHTMTSTRFRAEMASGFGYNSSLHYRKRPHYPIQRTKRRKQPLPEDLPSSSESSRRIFQVSPIISQEPAERPPCYNKPALEWDVFLDPNIVRQVDAAMAVVDNLGLKLRKAAMRRERRLAATATKRNNKNTYCKSMSTSSNSHIQYCKSTSVSSNANNSRVRSDGVKEGINDEIDDNDDFDVLQSHTAAEVEVDRLVSQLMRRTILAHGSMAQLVMEATGLAPSYNYGTVVKSSRDVLGNGSALVRTPSRPREHQLLHLGEGKSGYSLNTTKTWDEKEEQHDFEALLNATIMNKRDGKSDKGEKRRTGSQGMFMETWIHTFARTLTLLARSSNSSGGNDATVHMNSSNSSRSGDNTRLIEKLPGDVTQQVGISGLIGKMFLRMESSVSDLNIDTNDFDDDDSDMLTNRDMLSPTAPTSTSLLGNLCGMSLCLGMGSDDFKDGASSTFPLNPHSSFKMAQDIAQISAALGEPLRLVLDLKSRRVPPRVWSRLIDSLRTQGLIIDGIGSFDMDELRLIGKGCSYPLTPILFFHSVGDLQRACHANEVKDGDHVYFNGGSLMWKRTSIMEAAERGCCGALQSDHSSTAVTSPISATGFGGNYSFQPYACPRSSLSDWERIMCKSTIEDYRRHFNLRIGVYVQEFSISAEALDALTLFINKHSEIYDQGLAFGGVNGLSVTNISGDGYWNQRYMGRSWDFNARPSNEMTPLKPEDHHLVQKALQTGAWGQVSTIFEVPREPCDVINVVNSSF